MIKNFYKGAFWRSFEQYGVGRVLTFCWPICQASLFAQLFFRVSANKPLLRCGGNCGPIVEKIVFFTTTFIFTNKKPEFIHQHV
jgi:hypothetical protein